MGTPFNTNESVQTPVRKLKNWSYQTYMLYAVQEVKNCKNSNNRVEIWLNTHTNTKYESGVDFCERI